MLNLLCDSFIEIGKVYGRPALIVFGFPIYFYAIIIVSGISIAVVLAGFLFKKRGIDPYDITEYALVILPLGILGARLYFFMFPYSSAPSDWSNFFNFRDGGLGIYGGVILGYIGGYVWCKIKKQDWWLVADCIGCVVLLAQSIGRWGNFVNNEAYGNLVTNPQFQWFPYAVQIGSSWYQATFFYESMCTLVGFLICFFFLFNHKKYKKGWIASFYGIYYGLARLVIEGLRSDSLYLWVGGSATNIKISQFVSICTIILGLWRLSVIYRKQIHSLYSKIFQNEKQEVFLSFYVLLAFTIVLIGLDVWLCILAFPLTNATAMEFLTAVALVFLTVYCILASFALWDRRKLYCPNCGTRLIEGENVCPNCQRNHDVKLNQTLLKIFPYKVYPDFSVDGILPWVDPLKKKEQ